MKSKLIQGMFFQERQFLGISNEGGDARAVVSSGVARCMYSGIIFPRPDPGRPEAVGCMMDHYGDSEILDFVMRKDEMVFMKKYIKRGDLIEYNFKLVGPLWVGGYEGDAVGKGFSNCIITEVEDGFFLAPNFQPKG